MELPDPSLAAKPAVVPEEVRRVGAMKLQNLMMQLRKVSQRRSRHAQTRVLGVP